MKKIKLITFLFILLPVIVLAQKTVRGTVTDENNEPLAGAEVLEKNTNNGAVTDFDGHYSLKLKNDDAVLVFSYVGYETKEINTAGKTKIDVQMKPSANKLKEVVVVGYGSMNKRDLASSLSKVKEKEEIAAQYRSVSALLQGRAPGLKVISNTGSPGAPVSVRIRGSNSLRGNNEPLYVVDGIIINSAGEDVYDATKDPNEKQQTQNGLTGINPRDIESVVVLKDAAATAIYGSRGANGVILITTKKGKKGDASINGFASSSTGGVTRIIPVLDAVDYAEYRNESLALNGDSPLYEVRDNQVYLIKDGVVEDKPLKQINWQEAIFQNTVSNSGGVNISGGSKKSNYYMSTSLNMLDGIVPNTYLNSGNLRLNYTTKLNKKLKFVSRIGVYAGKGSMQQSSNIAGGDRSFTRQLISYKPLIEEGLEEDDPDLGISNPYSWLEGYEEKIDEKRLNAGLKFTYSIMKGLKYQIAGGTDFRKKYRSRWYGKETVKGSFTNGYLALSDLNRVSYTLNNLLMYSKQINDNNRLNATVGVTYDGTKTKNGIYEAGDFPISNLRDESPQLGSLVLTPYSSIGIEDAILSYIGRVTYTYKDKYILNASLRRDKSSKFRGDNKVGYFPAVSLAWLVTKEDFMADSKIFNDLKMRMSWGQVGNQAIKPYQTFNNFGAVYYSDNNNATVLGVAPFNIANKNLTWETTTQTNFGIDAGLFDNKIITSFDLYNKKTDNLLINAPTPTSTGFKNMLINSGSLQNKGFEFSIDANVYKTKDFEFSVGGNISVNRSKITDLSVLTPGELYIDGELQEVSYFLGNNVSTGAFFKAPANAFIEGQPIGVFWGYQTNGIYSDQAAADNGPTFFGNPNQAGDVVFVDVNGDGNINDLDKTIIGDPNPDFTYGFNTNFKYKNFTFDMLFSGTYGNDIMNANLLIENNAIGWPYNIRPDAYHDAWRPDNTDAAYPRLGSDTGTVTPTDRLIEDGSYFRLRNATLGYNFNLKNQKLIKNIHLYVSGNNLFTITNYSGYDPELTSFLYDGTIIGVDWLGTPNVRTYVLGLNLKF